MKKNNLLFLSIAIFFLVFAWIVFNIYHNSVKSTIPQTLNVQIMPINPNFDTQTLNKLKNRQKVTPIFELQKDLSQSQLSSPSANQSTSTEGATLK